jgi:hypothetical protein
MGRRNTKLEVRFRRQRKFLQLSPSLLAPQLRFPALTFLHGQRLQLIHDPGAHLHQPMAMPEQLPQIPILWTRYPDPLGRDLRRIADPQLKAQLCQQSLEQRE